MAATVVTPPAEEPVSLEEAKSQIRFRGTDQDGQIQRLIVAARRDFERRTNRSLVTRTMRLDLDGFPRGDIRLPFGPVSEITAVSYLDDAGAAVAVEAAQYVCDLTSDVATIAPAVGFSWPTPACRKGAVSVTYLAGYGAAAAVPEDAKHAILATVAHWFDDREADGPPGGALAIIENLKIDQLA